MNHFRIRTLFILSLLALTILSCATKREEIRNSVRRNVQNQNYNAVVRVLDRNKDFKDGKDRLVYLMEKGSALHYLGKYEESNRYLQEADLYIADYRLKGGQEALTYLSNPMASQYSGEDFEALFVNYFKALNYLSLGEYMEALVEAKRMNLYLQKMTDKYPENKYNRDAFIHLLMGIIYDANHEYNDALIAYKHAYEIYAKDYSSDYNIQIPDQLKYDILRTAKASGIYEDYDHYSKEFGIKYENPERNTGDLIVLWNNGLIAKKEDQIIQFALVSRGGGIVFADNSTNEEYRFAEASLKAYAVVESFMTDGLKVYRIAFPKYEMRYDTYAEGEIGVNGKAYNLERVEDLSLIAQKSLHDRKGREFSNALLRLAAKKLAKEATKAGVQQLLKEVAGSEDIAKLAGAVVDVTGAAIEKSDTRQWSALPHSISYTRLHLEEGEQKVVFAARGGGTYQDEFLVTIRKNETTFLTINTPSSGGYPPNHIPPSLLREQGYQLMYDDRSAPHAQRNEGAHLYTREGTVVKNGEVATTNPQKSNSQQTITKPVASNTVSPVSANEDPRVKNSLERFHSAIADQDLSKHPLKVTSKEELINNLPGDAKLVEWNEKDQTYTMSSTRGAEAKLTSYELERRKYLLMYFQNGNDLPSSEIYEMQRLHKKIEDIYDKLN